MYIFERIAIEEKELLIEWLLLNGAFFLSLIIPILEITVFVFLLGIVLLLFAGLHSKIKGIRDFVTRVIF